MAWLWEQLYFEVDRDPNTAQMNHSPKDYPILPAKVNIYEGAKRQFEEDSNSSRYRPGKVFADGKKEGAGSSECEERSGASKILSLEDLSEKEAEQ